MFENFKESIITKLFLCIIIVWIILAIIFGFTDLEISKAVVDENSNWGNFGADFGEPPGYALISIALATYLGGFSKNLQYQKIPAYISVIVGILFIVFSGDITDTMSGFALIIPVVIFVIITWKKDWSSYRTLSGVISLLTIIHPLLFVQLIKLFWGRVRFEDLSPGFIEFTPWFIPQGINGHQSFPSGHTAMSFMLMPLLIPLRTMYLKNRNKQILAMFLIFIVIGWALFVAASRVVVGAHYASDVLFSGGAACTITILLYNWFYVKRE
ncbi:MAG: phosphatase PAP2 family protein [Promethearchaeota archaeon]|jgi:membrane-associated phospholipid phosphatase